MLSWAVCCVVCVVCMCCPCVARVLLSTRSETFVFLLHYFPTRCLKTRSSSRRDRRSSRPLHPQPLRPSARPCAAQTKRSHRPHPAPQPPPAMHPTRPTATCAPSNSPVSQALTPQPTHDPSVLIYCCSSRPLPHPVLYFGVNVGVDQEVSRLFFSLVCHPCLMFALVFAFLPFPPAPSSHLLF